MNINKTDYVLKNLMKRVISEGELKTTRTGEVYSVWDENLEFNVGDGFPAISGKMLPWKAVVGELLWFLSKSKTIEDLKMYTFGEVSDNWTIWTDDATRWTSSKGIPDKNFVGDLYPTQWRNYNNNSIDQIQNLINGIIDSPNERNHIVMAWNVEAIHHDSMALKPCHLGFQCYVENGRLNLKWWQRSWDLFLGAPANIASYGLLLEILAKLCNLKPGKLSVSAGDVHIYKNHLSQVGEYLENPTHPQPKLILPEFQNIEELLSYNSSHFALDGYVHSGVIKAPLSVG